jgi:pimeloyl-ACP methyl ester carboxylesterase
MSDETPTVVLVHGVPETAAVWDLLVEHLNELGETDVRRLSPPGFGSPVPEAFVATMDGYRDWLIGELGSIGQPIDLVGHDWGGGHVLNVAMARPDLMRSWVSDIPGVFDPEYVWHDLAQQFRVDSIRVSTNANSGHPTSSMSAAELMSVPNVDGALVGGASLKASDFLAIAAACP